MNKTLLITAAVSIALLGVQSWRVHALKRELAQARPTAHEDTAHTQGVVSVEPTSDSLQESEAPSYSEGLSAPPVDTKTSTGNPVSAGPKATPINPRDAKAKPDAPIKKDAASASGSATANQLPAQLRKGMAQASKAFSDGDYETALRILEDAVREFPGEPQAYASLAKMYSDLGLIDDAIKTYRDWTDTKPDDARAFLGAAGLYEALGMNQEALDHLARYERLKEGAPDGYAAAASMYRRLGMPDQELRSLTKWVDAAPTSPQAYLALGEYYRRNGDPANALIQYQQATALAPGNVTAHTSLASAYQQLGQLPNAQAELLAAVSIHPGDTSLQMRLADLYRRGGDLGSAIATYQNVIQQEPNSANALQASQQIARLQQQLNPRPKQSG